MKFIPVNEPLLNGNEKAYLSECIDSGWISSEGPFVSRFEEQFSAKVGRRYGVAVMNGTAALDIAVEALGIGRGDEVILPAFTIISCVLQILRVGALPVLVDSDPITWNMNIGEIEDKITERTKAIMVVHTYGLPVDMDPVLELARRYQLKVIEDAAEAHGQTYKGRPCGSFGDVSTFSFYPNKHITTGEGGMLVSDCDAIATDCRSLRNLCFESGRRFLHERLGWNMRMTNLQAAVGVAQLERLDEFVVRKRDMGQRYNALLEDVETLQLPHASTAYAENIYWVYGVVIHDTLQIGADEAISRLGEQGIGCRPFFWPMHEQPVLRRMGLFKGERYPVAERLARKGFYLPSGLGLTRAQQEQVCGVLRETMCG